LRCRAVRTNCWISCRTHWPIRTDAKSSTCWGCSRSRFISSPIYGVSLPAIHKHIKVLENAGLISRRKEGRTNYLTLDPRPLALLQSWVNQFHLHWGSDVATYANYARHLGFNSTEARPPPSPEGAQE